jgi:hypothetical protein
MGAAPVFASVSEAMDMVRANSVAAAARTCVLGAFTAGKGYSADADYSVQAWLMHKTGVTQGAAKAHAAWVRRAARHPQLFATMAAEGMSESYAHTVSKWTDLLPADKRGEADALLAQEAAAGMGLRDLAVLDVPGRRDHPQPQPARPG